MPVKDNVTDRGMNANHKGALACLFIAIILLSNPFLTLFRPPGDASVRHLASHRATIGSSELQHFSPVSSEAAPELCAAGIDSERVPARVRPVRTTSNEHVDRATASDFSASLWFRPPPAS